MQLNSFAVCAIITLCISALSPLILYKEMRMNIAVIPYTPMQKIQVAQSIKNMFTIYCSRQSKIDNYGAEFPNIDPIKRVGDIIKNAPNINDLDFHYKFVELFMSLRDFHAEYQIPGPHKCVTLYQAIVFDIIGYDDDQKIIASSRNSEHIRILSPSAEIVSIGDELIAVFGVPIKDFIVSRKFETGGANEAGSTRATILALSRISGTHNMMPEKDYTLYQFKSSIGRIYSVEIPWVSYTDSECWSQSQNLFSGNFGSVKTAAPLLNLEMKDKDKTEVISLAHKSERPSIVDPVLNWEIFKPNSKNMGIIILTSFDYPFAGSNKIIQFIRHLLLGPLCNTSAILFDVRGNRGGILKLADMIPQLFGFNIKSGYTRIVSNTINKNIYSGTRETDWINAFANVKQGDSYTPWIKIRNDLDINRIGQVYLNPVGIFTNGQCYSACEIFAANMKDNTIATIFGEDISTGGGGAIVVDYNSFLTRVHPKHFLPLPFARQNPLVAQDLSIGWKQIVRVSGKQIEDVGVESDYIIRPVLQDLIGDSKSISQYERIADILIEKGHDNGKNGMKFQVYPDSHTTIEIGQVITFRILSKGFKKIEIICGDGYIQNFANVNPSILSNNIFEMSTQNYLPRIYRFRIRGFDANELVAFSTWRSITFTAQLKTYLSIFGPFKIPIDFKYHFIGLYDDSPKVESGWMEHQGFVHIKGIDEEVESTLSFFLNSSKRYEIHIKGNYRTTLERDLFNIGYIQGEMLVSLFDSQGETQGLIWLDRMFDLPAGQLELFIRFSSEEGSVSGATIELIEII